MSACYGNEIMCQAAITPVIIEFFSPQVKRALIFIFPKDSSFPSSLMPSAAMNANEPIDSGRGNVWNHEKRPMVQKSGKSGIVRRWKRIGGTGEVYPFKAKNSLNTKRTFVSAFQGLYTLLENKVLAYNLCLVLNYVFGENCEIGK